MLEWFDMLDEGAGPAASILRRRLALTGGAGLILGLRLLYPPRSLEAVGIVAIRDLGLTFALWLLVLGISAALGIRILRRFAPSNISPLEVRIFGYALGAGGLACIVLGLGLVGWLTSSALAILLLGLTAWLAPEMREISHDLSIAPRRGVEWWRTADKLEKAVASIAVIIGLLSLLSALSPPWDYDGLMYHLVGPKLFLEAGRIYPYPDNWYVNAPFNIEMLFAVGMAFGDDVFPKLIHYSMGLLLAAATYAVARRWLSVREAWLALGVLLTVPTLPIWAGFAYIDLGWSAYEFLALAALLIWQKDSSTDWIALGGVMIGLAMGSKYLGLMGFAILAGFVLLAQRGCSWKERAGSLLWFGIPALAIAAPWYLKNAIWYGNPIFPLGIGGPGWDQSRLEHYMTYLDSFGVGRSLKDYVLLPWNIFVHRQRFGAVMNRIDIPSVLFPLALLLPWKSRRRVVNSLALIALARFLLWALGSQQTRFLLPIYPALAISASHVMETLRSGERDRWILDNLLPTVSIGLLLVTIFYQVRVALQFDPVRVNLGIESRDDFFGRIVKDYPAIRYVRAVAPHSARVLLLGDGRGYHCLPICVPDPDHFRWSREIAALDVKELGAWFAEQGFSYLLLSWEDLDFLLQHDRNGVMAAAVEVLIAWRDSGCIDSIFRDDWTELYEISCGASVDETASHSSALARIPHEWRNCRELRSPYHKGEIATS